MAENESYTVRVARDDELEKLAAVERRAGQLFASTAHAYVCGAPTLSPAVLMAQHQLGAVWIAVNADDEPVGFAVAGELGDEAYLYELDVDIAHGRRGLGRRLLAEVFDWARDRGYATITLSTFKDIAWNAPFYETLGFEVIEEAALTPEMVETRSAEAKAGLRVDCRVFMRCALGQSR